MNKNAVDSCDSILVSFASAAKKAGQVNGRRSCYISWMIDLDDGVKHNYALLPGVELPRDGRRAVKGDLLASL